MRPQLNTLKTYLQFVFFLMILLGNFGCGESTKDSGQASIVECTTSNPEKWSTGVSSLISVNCISCHSELGAYNSAAAKAKSIANEVESGSMPQGSGLSAADKQAIVQWAACGAPQ
jgi:hypothetical protein